MKYYLLITAFSLIVFSCKTEKSNQLPVEEDKMIDVLKDMYLLQARVEYQLPFDSTETLTKASVFAHHGITQELFDSTLKILISNPAYMRTIQDSVDKRIQNLQKRTPSSNR